MRSALSIVLRRDLSLNRRLYTWLLGISNVTAATTSSTLTATTTATAPTSDATASELPDTPATPITSINASSDSQIKYFEKYGLELLCDTLLSSIVPPASLIFSVSSDPDPDPESESGTEQSGRAERVDGSEDKVRAYKILVSLLDKWEIGNPVVERLGLSVFESVKARGDDDVGPVPSLANKLCSRFFVSFCVFIGSCGCYDAFRSC